MDPPVSFRLVLCDQEERVVKAWEEAFAGLDEMDIRLGDFFDVQAEAYVSPANSYGVMDGSFGLALRDYFGFDLEERVQEAIMATGERLPVGQALVVETGDEEVPCLVVAPTMETPSLVAETSNAYDAMRAILAAVQSFDEAGRTPIETVAIPGLCTGIGGMDPATAAAQMRQACDDFLADSTPWIAR